MANKIKCTCGHSWNKSDSSKKDVMVCHICGKNNMKNGGWLNKYNDVPEAQNGRAVSDETRVKPIVTDKPINRETVKSTNKSYRMSPQEALLNKLKGKKLKESQDRLNKTAEKITAVGSLSPNPLVSIPSAIGNLALGITGASTPGDAGLDYMGAFGSAATPNSARSFKKVARRLPFFKGINAVDALSDIFEFTPSEDLPKKQDGGWLDKFDAPEAQNGIEGTMGGLTDKGFNYNGAWGGPSMQMGGAMPGAVGFTYERTQGAAPSNGPYAKKTMASAQNGAEMKFYQEGLDWKPRNISQDGTSVKKPRTDMLTMDEYRLKKALADQPVIQSPRGKQLTKEQILAKNKQYAEAQGKRFNPETGAVTPFLSPSTARTFERASENIVEPMIAMSPMGEVGMIRDASNLSKPFISGVTNKLGVGAARALFTAQKHLPAGIVKDNLLGAAYGVRDVTKGRPFFETFPITGKQRRAVEAAQDKAFNEGLGFVKDWNYSNQGLDVNGMPIMKIRPEVEARIESIYPDLYSSPTNINEISGGNPIFSAKNLLVNSRTIPVFKNKSLSQEAKNYIFRNRGTIGGFNMGATDESITLRNYGPYYSSSEDIKNVAAHELGHSMQKLGNVYGDDWGQQIAKYDRDYKYQIPNTDTPFGKLMGEAMVEPVKGKYTWEASPLEPHSELMAARMKAYDHYKNIGHSAEEALQALQNPDDDLVDWLIDKGDLNRFFKPATSQEAKRKIIKGLPAAVPAISIGAAAAAVDKKKKGGKVKKDDNGYWNPENWGEPVEIGSNDITMQGVYEPLLGVSDTGDTQMMYPGEDYTFDGESVTEYPVAQNGKKVKIPMSDFKKMGSNYVDSLNTYDYTQALWEALNKGNSSEVDQTILRNKNLINNTSNVKPTSYDNITVGGKNYRIPSYEYPKMDPWENYEPVKGFWDNVDSKLSSISNTIGKTAIGKSMQKIDNKIDEGVKKVWRKFVDNDKEDNVQNQGATLSSSVKKQSGPPKQSPPQSTKPKLENDSYIKKYPPIYLDNPKDPRIGQYTEKGNQYLYKKPKQSVEYKKPKSKQEVVKKQEPTQPPVKKTEQPKPIERKQNVYEGSPVYSPGAGIGMGSALIGFLGQQGDTTYIKPEDYERFAVPKYGKEFIESKTKKKKNGGWLEKYK